MTVTLRAQSGELRQVPLRDLVVSKHNPRTDVGDVSELEASIREHGVLEPLVVVRENGHFAVVAGSRRLAAAKKAQLPSVPVVVKEMSDEDQAAAALIENLQRRDLAPLEEARGYRAWLDLTKKTQAELAKSIGKAPSTVANALRLLEAPKPVQTALADGTFTAAHARVALELKDPSLAARLPTKRVTVEQLQEDVRRLNEDWLTEGPPAIAAIKAELEDAKKKHPSAEITWGVDEYGYSSERAFSVRALGKPPAKIQGRVPSEFTKQHEKVCGCEAYALVSRLGYGRSDDARRTDVQRVCIKAAGWRKLQDERIYGGRRAARPKQTPAAREKARKAKEKKADQEAQRALVVDVDVPYSANDRGRRSATVDKKLLKGGPAGENARLALWAFTARDIWNADGGRAALWQRIARMPIAKVRDLLAQHAAAKALSLLLSRKDERQQLTELIYGHFGIEIPEPKKPKAKKAAKR